MKASRSGALLACLGWCALSSCNCLDPHYAAGTAFRIHVYFEDAWGLNQLRFTGTSGSGIVFGPALRPAVDDGGVLTGEQIVRVDLKDSLSGEVVIIDVDGVRHGLPIASGSAWAVIETGYEPDVPIFLSSDAGADAGTDAGVDGG